jgi:hypothetical protein
MVGAPGLRFALEAGFLIALAVVAGLAELRATTIVLVMGAAWLLVAVIEWLAWREAPRMTRAAREEAAPAFAEPPTAPSEPGSGWRFWRRGRREAEPEPAGEDTQDLAPPSEHEPTPVSANDRTSK